MIIKQFNAIKLLFLRASYRWHYDSLVKKLNFTLQTFYDMDILQQKNLNEVVVKKHVLKAKNLNELIRKFNNNLKFQEVSERDKKMIFSFYYFFFYQTFVKYFNKANLEFEYNLIDLSIDDSNYSGRKEKRKIFEINLNNAKRQHYYRFLDHFQTKPDYNLILIKLLRKVL
ncbi:hypothetical protein [Mycoplasma nasistruthionis]|nr:hypothetical protein [Mycoplasma nasistruthionis]